MKLHIKCYSIGIIFKCFLLASLAAALMGCENDSFDHHPPAGQGSLIVNNKTVDDLHVYISEHYTNDVSDFDYEIYDLDPSVCRVVLDEKGGYRSYRGDVDVLEGQLTVLTVWRNPFSTSEYDVNIHFE